MSLGARARNDYFSTRFLTRQQVLSLRNATPRLHKDRKTKKLLPETQKKNNQNTQMTTQGQKKFLTSVSLDYNLHCGF